MAAEDYDVVVVGAGPAGYVAAIRAAQLGLKSACIDRWLNAAGEPSLGGTCLNVGCIPSKALLESSALYARMAAGAAEHGIIGKGVSLDLATMMARKSQVVNDLTGGIEALFKGNGVTAISGSATLLPERRVRVEPHDKGRATTLQARHVILAPGSSPNAHPQIPFDGERVVDSSGALAFDTVPKRLAIVGAGVIGLELGSVWRRLGAEVVLIDISKGLLPMADQRIARQAQSAFKRQGLVFRFGCKVTASRVKRNGVELTLEDGKGESVECFDRVVVAVGRHPNTEGLIDDRVGIVLDERGRIEIDEQCRTAVEGVYAIGDAVRGPMLAHKGSEEGVVVAERIAGHAAQFDYATVPSVVYTAPEIAWVGESEESLKAAGVEYSAGSFPFAANGRARAGGESEGVVKVLADAKTDRILGVHMLGPHVSELIGQAVLAMSYGGSAEDLALTIAAHPSLGEALREAALDVGGNAIHKARPGR